MDMRRSGSECACLCLCLLWCLIAMADAGGGGREEAVLVSELLPTRCLRLPISRLTIFTANQVDLWDTRQPTGFCKPAPGTSKQCGVLTCNQPGRCILAGDREIGSYLGHMC
ncbi:hypothetical protein EJ05DRAFT_485427 [Pseudovirgaria hyperparasitica]|uniref:Uncharacterized protein n=1 Tax=Pseudovirgaria hyperparasitica TaxID=470096 RepID=A0A6A6WB57_9PEZI|nr:uncharacterized protein EJ05DRAFT_485427 [Pseudovirgaria hyperparasitica]KAF2759409.1 hypothetical protein EJ05DRAFT_485427 [Pseudovirgaria hyperparasitica]